MDGGHGTSLPAAGRSPARPRPACVFAPAASAGLAVGQAPGPRRRGSLDRLPRQTVGTRSRRVVPHPFQARRRRDRQEHQQQVDPHPPLVRPTRLPPRQQPERHADDRQRQQQVRPEQPCMRARSTAGCIPASSSTRCTPRSPAAQGCRVDDHFDARRHAGTPPRRLRHPAAAARRQDHPDEERPPNRQAGGDHVQPAEQDIDNDHADMVAGGRGLRLGVGGLRTSGHNESAEPDFPPSNNKPLQPPTSPFSHQLIQPHEPQHLVREERLGVRRPDPAAEVGRRRPHHLRHVRACRRPPVAGRRTATRSRRRPPSSARSCR